MGEIVLRLENKIAVVLWLEGAPEIGPLDPLALCRHGPSSDLIWLVYTRPAHVYLTVVAVL